MYKRQTVPSASSFNNSSVGCGVSCGAVLSGVGCGVSVGCTGSVASGIRDGSNVASGFTVGMGRVRTGRIYTTRSPFCTLMGLSSNMLVLNSTQFLEDSERCV